jgi:hypothetical protein
MFGLPIAWISGGAAAIRHPSAVAVRRSRRRFCRWSPNSRLPDRSGGFSRVGALAEPRPIDSRTGSHNGQALGAARDALAVNPAKADMLFMVTGISAMDEVLSVTRTAVSLAVPMHTCPPHRRTYIYE